ncbi:SH3 domain-containing protein [Pseudooceanicola aestuarii]|uniref:SH3 domain-containing protein n=1 Tax=Pseudooceanicola aestuarii TaxID=2697319 RepID=UPI0013D0FB26|nr:SH3 domain-containing protein [Pseudooceanicola aestuarii]
MKKFLVVTTFFLGWAFYEVSGGAEFDPAETTFSATAAEPVSAAPIVSTRSAVASDTAATASQTGKMRVPDKPADTETATAPAPSPAVADLPLVVVTKASLSPEIAQALEQARAPVQAEPAADIRQVAGSRVNMRSGPGTRYSVMASLREGQDVEILQEPGNGWVKLRVIDGGRIGWMADWLVTASN